MKKISNYVVAIAMLVTPLLMLTSVTSAATKNIHINSNIEARVVFGDHIEHHETGNEVVGDEFMVDSTGINGNVDETKLVLCWKIYKREAEARISSQDSA